jgi:hypothetical protein
MNLVNLNRVFAFFALVAANCHSAFAKDGQARRLKKSRKATTKSSKTKKYPKASPSVFNESSLSPTVNCDVTDFVGLQVAINGDDGGIKLCSGSIVFTEQLVLSDKILTFTCPNGGCVLDAASNDGFFYIAGVTNNISFDGITFKNGKVSGVSQQ